jgi:pyruvate formate lyase activating enzyme
MNTSDDRGLHEAKFWRKEGERLECFLCPHHCSIAPNKIGICGVRQNQNGRLYSLIYGRVSAMHVDPMEKKPLFHFHPGQPVLSLGSVGCNLRCQHCQNFSISQTKFGSAYLNSLRPEDVPQLAKESACRDVAFTYNEPTIWHEFSYDVFKLCRNQGISTIYVTNGFIEEEPLRELAPYLNAMNIDVKGFKEGFYRHTCKARLGPVLEATILAHDLGVHVELTYLIIPGRNDKEEEIKDFCKWVANKLSPKVPVHFSRFHPDYLMTDIPGTPIATMEMSLRVAKAEGLRYVYLGNVQTMDGENTRCPHCGSLAVRRSGYRVEITGLRNGGCSKCGEPLDIIT